MDKSSEEKVVASVITRLDEEHAKYQELHMKFYGHDDERAKYLHRCMVTVAKDIMKEIRSER